MPKVSIIVPNYNHAQYLKQRIDSILNQTYQDFELILLDDFSTDNSCEVLDSYKDHPKVSHCVYNDQNSGSTFRQWQKGVELSKGEYIWIAESDDWAESEFLSTLCSLFDTYPNVGIAYCNTAIYKVGQLVGDFATEKRRKYGLTHWDNNYYVDGKKEIETCLVWDCTINNASAVLMRNDILLKILPNLYEFRYSGDWFCYLQIAAVSDIAYCAKVMNNYRDHIFNISKKAGYSYLVEVFYIYNWLLNNKVLTDKRLLIKAFHAYVSDVYSNGLVWDLKKDLRELRPINLELFLSMTWKLLKRNIRHNL